MRRRMTRRALVGLVAAATAALTAVTAIPPAGADNGTDTAALRAAVTSGDITAHLEKFQGFASTNGGTRAAGTAGHVASAEYVETKLAGAGYRVTRQYFTYTTWQETAGPTLAVADGPTYTAEVDYTSMAYSGSGSASGTIQAVDLLLPPVGGSTSGCETADFAGFVTGRIALIQRGTCTFAVKARNAQAAGASGVIIFNEGNDAGRTELLSGTIGADPPALKIPVIGTTFALGNTLAATGGNATLSVTATFTDITSYNVLADTMTGRTDRIVVAGGHLDSVREGPGINDNGSGTAMLLEVALQMNKLGIKPRNQVRFAFWSGEEDGLIGSEFYAAGLSARDIKNHAANLNFDMIASPNYGRFIYDGDGSASPDAGPNGSDVIEDIFEQYFAAQGLTTAPTAFDGRSDYGGFIDRGIPAGGLFTGAEDVKTTEEATLFGGKAAAPFDACYHQACDGIANINQTALEQMSDAAAHAILTLGMTTSALNGTGQGSGGGSIDLLRKGERFVK